MEKIALVIAFRQLVNSSIEKLTTGGVKPEVVYAEFIKSRNNILIGVNGVTNRKEHLALMQIANKVYVNPTTRSNVTLLKKEFEKCLRNLPSAVNNFKK